MGGYCEGCGYSEDPRPRPHGPATDQGRFPLNVFLHPGRAGLATKAHSSGFISVNIREDIVFFRLLPSTTPSSTMQTAKSHDDSLKVKDKSIFQPQ